jgi:hypothetical protein
VMQVFFRCPRLGLPGRNARRGRLSASSPSLSRPFLLIADSSTGMRGGTSVPVALESRSNFPGGLLDSWHGPKTMCSFYSPFVVRC